MGKIGRKEGHKGYWKGKTFNKPSVFTDVNEWIGWGKLEKIVNKPERKRDRMILKTMFETGSRVSEVIKYRKENFKIEPNIIRVQHAPLVKHKQLEERWDFLIEKTEPFAQELIEYIENIDNWLFPSTLGEKPYLTRQHAWNVAKKADVYPHWFRSMRAFCLSWYHDLNVEELRAWFTWTDSNTPQHYARPSPDKTAEKFTKYK